MLQRLSKSAKDSLARGSSQSAVLGAGVPASVASVGGASALGYAPVMLQRLSKASKDSSSRCSSQSTGAAVGAAPPAGVPAEGCATGLAASDGGDCILPSSRAAAVPMVRLGT